MHVEPSDMRPAYRFGPYRLSPADRRLTCGDDAVSLPPKVFDLLQLLVVEEGRLVSRERIVAAIWPDVIVSETNLRQTIWQLRRSLRRREGLEHECIETVPRHGYRFVAPVHVEGSSDARVRSAAVAAPAAPGASRRPGVRRVLLLAAACLAVGSAGHVGGPASGQVSEAAAPAGERHTVAILRLRTHSGDASDGWIADAFTEILRAELAASPSLRLVPAETIDREVADLSPPRVLSLSSQSLTRLREHVGGDTVVAGALVAAGPGPDAGLRVDLLIQCTRSRGVTATLTLSGLRRDLPALAGRAARELRRVLAARTAPTAG